MRQTAAINNRAFIVSLSSRFVDSSLHQRDSLVRALLSFGDAAIGLRQGNRLLEVGQALSSLPLPQSIQSIGSYFKGVATADRQQLEQAVYHAPPRYRARAALALGWYAKNHGDDRWPIRYAEAMREARAAQDVFTAIHASKMLAIRRAVEGDHWRAIDDLESLWPMLRLIAREDPATYYDVLNSLAVELLEVGKLDEAARAIRIVAASPLIAFNPEWRETAEEVQEALAQALVIAVPELKREPRSRRHCDALIIALSFHQSRVKTSLSSGHRVHLVLLLPATNRASIRAGPRAPPNHPLN